MTVAQNVLAAIKVSGSMGGIVSTGRTTHYRPGQCAIYVTTCKISCTLLAKVQATSCAEECEAAAYHHPYIHIGIQAQLALCSSQGAINVANICTKSSVLIPATTATFMLCKLQLTKVPSRCAKSATKLSQPGFRRDEYLERLGSGLLLQLQGVQLQSLPW